MKSDTSLIKRLRRYWHPAVLLLSAPFCMAHAVAQDLAPPPVHLRTLTTVREVHDLSAEQARRAYPVHLRAVVTYYDPYNDGKNASLFVQDETAGIFVIIPSGSEWPGNPPHAGSLVDVAGVSSPGDYAALIAEAQIRVLGESHMPLTAKPVSFTRLSSGVDDAQFVEIEGVVHSITEAGRRLTLNITMADGLIGAMTVKDPSGNYAALVDAKVRIRGSVGTLFNENRQMIGSHILFNDLGAVTVIEPSPLNIFALPVSPIDTLSRFTPTGSLPHRVHVRGTVTLQWPGSMICIQDEKQGICAQSVQTTPLQAGDVVDIGGFVVSGGYKPALVDSVFQSIGHHGVISARPVTAMAALDGKRDEELVQIEGRLIGRDLAAKEPTLLLSSGDLIFPVLLGDRSASASAANLGIGSVLRVIGICSVTLDSQGMANGSGYAISKSFRILMRSPRDLVVLATPSWWTVTRVLLVLGLALALTAIVIGWVFVLRRRVEQQTKIIRESEERFRHMAQHDSLTGLPTRVVLHERLGMALHKSRQFKTGIALLMLDLDDFKHVNDTLGHDGGDQTLCVMARRIESAIRASDLVARMGGDEFVVLLDDLNTAEQAERVAAKIVASLSVPIQVGKQEVPVSVSVGVCAIFDGFTDPEALLKSVDLAMYHAKQQGRNCFKVFTDEMAAVTLAKQRVREGLGHALERRELELHYQPIVNCDTGRLDGFEALLRWRSKELGFVMPSDFIPVAEESGLILPIGEWVLREACREIGILEDRMQRNFTLAVNLSPRQLLQRELSDVVRQALTTSGRAPQQLKLEITESILMSDSLETRNSLRGIRDLGVQLAIDDFGIGFSSLSYISRFPVDWIKIDRSFISGCTTDAASIAVVRAIIAMAHSLDIHVIAEGVETAEQLAMIRNEACDAVQGYFYSRPVPAADLPRLVASLDLPEEDYVEVAAPRSVARASVALNPQTGFVR